MARKKELAPTAEYTPVQVHCAHETCDLPAMCKVKTPTGWANFCIPHYTMHFDGLARKRCAELGLDQQPNESKAEWQKRLLALVKFKPKAFKDAQQAEDEWATGS